MRDRFSHTCKHWREINSPLPEWIVELLWGVANHLDELTKTLEIAIQGNRMVQGFPEFVAILGPSDESEDAEKHAGRLSDAEITARAAFAKNEAEKGHPILHGNALVAIWSAVDTCIEDIAVGLLLNDPAILKNEVFSKIRIPLAEFEILDKEERARFLLGEVERQKASRRHGVARFESFLEPFGLSGAVADDVKQHVYACNHMRNVIVHRRSVVDRKLVENCPWLNLKIGERLVVTTYEYQKYHHYLWKYLETVIKRLRRYFLKKTVALAEDASPPARLVESEQPAKLKDNCLVDDVRDEVRNTSSSENT
jgi:hypothetical protein